MDKRNIFLYWTGKTYKLVSILQKLVYLHSTSGKGYSIHLINDKNIVDYIKFIPDCFNTLCPAHQADFVRVNVICDYGGIWLDSDTLVLDSLDTLFDILESNDGFLIKENNAVLCNGVFGSKKNTELMLEWKKIILEILGKNNTISWTTLGSSILNNLYSTKNTLYSNYKIFNGLDNLYPIFWKNCVNEFIKKPYDNYKTIIREYQPLIVLVNSVYKELETMTDEHIINGTMPINYFINKSFNNVYNNNYNNLIKSSEFIDNLNYLNTTLKDSLIKNNYMSVLLGNLFYDHEQKNPPFYSSELLKDCEEKRIRLFKAAQMKTHMVEIGLNGGHSSFLCLMANKDIIIYANDIAEYYPPCPNIHPEIYVLVAANTLSEIFRGRFNFIKGSCLTEIPKFVKSNPDIKIDLVHIDGAKHTYKQDFLNIIPLLEDGALVVFDDSNNIQVERTVNELISANLLYRTNKFPQMDTTIKYRNEILIYHKTSNTTIFSNIYKTGIWNDNNSKIPLSGPGSSLENTEECRKLLDTFIHDNKCSSVLDLGCGDLTWIPRTTFFNDATIRYIGIDIVENLINSHSSKYSNKQFICQDIVSYTNYDKVSLIVFRDVLFHLTNNEVLTIFKNIKCKFDFIAITSCKNEINTDTFNNYRFTERNIHKSPYNISINYIDKVEEPIFKRAFYIYPHNEFYSNLN
jgi:hypothetical protein